jgi:hypothetical protein
VKSGRRSGRTDGGSARPLYAPVGVPVQRAGGLSGLPVTHGESSAQKVPHHRLHHVLAVTHGASTFVTVLMGADPDQSGGRYECDWRGRCVNMYTTAVPPAEPA